MGLDSDKDMDNSATDNIKFPTLYCVCLDGHTWGTLIPVEWFALKDIQCPICGKVAEFIRAGDWKNLAQIKQEQSQLYQSP